MWYCLCFNLFLFSRTKNKCIVVFCIRGTNSLLSTVQSGLITLECMLGDLTSSTECETDFLRLATIVFSSTFFYNLHEYKMS